MRTAGILLLIVLVGCSGKMLDNQTAEEKIGRVLKHDDHKIIVLVGRVGANCQTVTIQGDKVDIDQNPTSDVPSQVAKAEGYITVAPDGANYWKVDLTEKGKAATVGKPLVVTPQRGCDYQQINFSVATPELVKLTGITADENNPEVEYIWRWKVTELGQELRKDGKVFTALNQNDRSSLENINLLGDWHLPIPVPPEDFTAKGTMKFKKFTDGWRPQR
jgi:hypothetical protein